MLSFPKIRQHVVEKLENGLSPALTYHNLEHTLDVLKQAEVIAAAEGVTNEEDMLLLKVAALYHDVGFLRVYSGHEEESCHIAAEDLNGFGFNARQIERVKGMIRATKVPQKPNNLLEQIICDSDLDYLGRDDFFTIGEGLYHEFTYMKIVHSYNDWDLLQIRFLENHQYFTRTSIQRREQAKRKHLEIIKARVKVSV